MHFGDLLRSARETRRMTQGQLARASGVPQPYIWHLETGRRSQPTAEVFAALLYALHLHPDEYGPMLRLLADRRLPQEKAA